MKVIEDLNRETVNEQVKTLAANASEIDTDSLTSYVDLKDFVPRHNAQAIPEQKVGEALFNRLLVTCVSYKNEFRYLYTDNHNRN